MNIIFEYQGKRLILPVNPEEIEVDIPSPSKIENVIGVGQVSIPQSANLAKVSIKSFFWKYLFDNDILKTLGGLSSSVNNVLNSANSLVGGGLTDDSSKFKLLNEYVQWFKEWKASNKPARWTIVVPPNEPPQCFDFNVTCEDFKYKIVAGEETDYYYELELLEYREFGAKKIDTKTDENGNITAQPNNNKPRVDNKEPLQPKITAKKPLNTVWSMTQANARGDFKNWKSLYNILENKSTIASNLQNLAGQTLKMPKEWLDV